MEIADFTQVITTYDTVAADYAARLPATEPEDPLELAMIDPGEKDPQAVVIAARSR